MKTRSSLNYFVSYWRSGPQLTEISVRRGNIFTYERIFPAEWDNPLLWSRCKKVLRNHSINCNNSYIIILFTKNFKQLFFVLMLVKQTKVLCCLWVSIRHWTPTKENLALIFSNTTKLNYFLQVYVTHFEYWLLSKFSHLTARQNKSRPRREIFRIWTRGNNIFFPVKRENNGKTIFIWIAPKKTRANFVTMYFVAKIKSHS